MRIYLWQTRNRERERKREREREFSWGIEKERKKRVFFYSFFHLIKVSHWNQEGAQLFEKLGDQNRIGEKIFSWGNQVTWRAQDWKAIMDMFIDLLWFDICMIQDP